jgi:CubicO group peptidase (beta-lactamase class C family)
MKRMARSLGIVLCGILMATTLACALWRWPRGGARVSSAGSLDQGALSTLSDGAKRLMVLGASGATVIAMKDGRQLLRIDCGDATEDTSYCVASASKWMTAALVMTAVDSGELSLDEKVSRVLPEFSGPPGEATIRELLAQTAGEGSLPSRVDERQDPRITLAESAAQIDGRALEDQPGAVFKYGGPGFQVAGAALERVTGRRWADLFEDRIAQPLGMKSSYWTHGPRSAVPPVETLNPLLQGGLVTTASDYMRFLTMLASGGIFEGRVILSRKSVDEMERVQTLGKPMAYMPEGVLASAQYGLGNWTETWDDTGSGEMVSSPGAFGAYPWIDRKSGVYGIFFLNARLPRVMRAELAERHAILDRFGR